MAGGRVGSTVSVAARPRSDYGGGVLYRSWDLDLEEKLIADVAASLRSAGFPTAPEPPPTPSGTRRTFSLTLDGPSRVLGKPDCVRVELSPASPLPEPRAEICTLVDGIVAAALGKRVLGVRPRRDVRVLPRRKRGRNGP